MNKINLSISEKIFQLFNYIFLGLIMIITLYPCYYVLIASISEPSLVYNSGGLLFYPKGVGFYSYLDVIKSAQLWVGYRNTIVYVLAGGAFSVLLTIMAAYVLSRREFPGKNIILIMILFTMYFSGGLIPTYLVVKWLGITDTIFAMIIPGAISTYNLIITLTYFKNMPVEIEEAAKIDGANEYMVLYKIMLPLAAPIVAVIALYYSVAIWNNYFTGLIYINKRSLYSLQMVIREILIQNGTDSISSQSGDAEAYSQNVKYAIIVVSTIPILLVYPFLQKYFIKGIMIGAVKG